MGLLSSPLSYALSLAAITISRNPLLPVHDWQIVKVRTIAPQASTTHRAVPREGLQCMVWSTRVARPPCRSAAGEASPTPSRQATHDRLAGTVPLGQGYLDTAEPRPLIRSGWFYVTPKAARRVYGLADP
jgi:hypothetical protein